MHAKIFRNAGLIAAAALISGCAAAPLGYQIASWTMTGLSYATTGKSLSDHAISLVMERDCALHRLVTDQQVCIPEDPTGVDTALAAAEIAPPEITHPLPDELTRVSVVAPVQPVRLYAVAGSYRERANADDTHERLANSAVATAEVAGKRYFRVVVGPVADEDWGRAARRLAHDKLAGAWPVRLCETTLAPPPCGDVHQQRVAQVHLAPQPELM